MEASIKEPNVLQTYEELKSEFEKYACRIDDVLLYPVLDTKNERTLYTLLQLKERFSHLKYLEGKTEHKFVQEWADDPNKKAFRNIVTTHFLKILERVFLFVLTVWVVNVVV